MRILIATVGSLGDVQPYVAMGRGLQRAGHSVTVCTSARFQPFVVEHGLAYAYLNNDLLDILDSAEGRAALEDMGSMFSGIKAALKLIKRAGPIQRSLLQEGWTAAEECRPDLIIYNSKMGGALHYAEKLDVMALMAVTFPQLVPTTAFPSIGFPKWQLGGTYNKLTYKLVLKIGDMVSRKFMNEWRSAHNLPLQPPGSDILHRSDGKPVPVLHGVSPHVVARPIDWPSSAEMTGYWFLDAPEEWKPPADLEEFLASGVPPVYIGFGSMARKDPRQAAQIAIAALQEVGARGVLARGWGGLTLDQTTENVFVVDQVPHDWLFPRTAAVVHHGGAGTTAAGLRAGCPTVICPFFGDQPFWGWRVHELGVGTAPIPQRKLTVAKLASALEVVLTNEAMRRKAKDLGDRIRRDDGIATAVSIVNRLTADAE